MATHRGSIRHLPALDGLRGLAVLGVVLFHAEGLLTGGYLGVDLFFVLSGFLITSILCAERDRTGRIDLGAFWIRRARRLFPALLALMPAVAVYARVFAKPDELRGLRLDAAATLAYVANWRAIFSEKSYWDLFAAPSPLEHTWSLAIEEQFYVLWPLLFTAVAAIFSERRKGMLAVTIALLAASIVVALRLFDPEASSRVYFGTDTRAAAILAGAALALVLGPEPDLSDRTVRALDGFALPAAALLAWTWWSLDGQDPRLYRGGFWATEAACLVLIACGAAGSRSIAARVMSARPLVWAGNLSYGIYLWHWPIDCVLTPERVHVTRSVLLLMRFAATAIIAVASYRWLEQPIRRRGLGVGRPVLVTLASFLAAFGVVVVATRARTVAVSPGAVQPRVAPSAVASAQPEWPGIFSVDSHTLPPPSALRPATRRILVVGDSVSAKLGFAMRFRQEEFDVFVAERGVGDCSIMESLTVQRFDPKAHPNPGHGCAAAWTSDVHELRPDITFVVLGGAFFAKMTIGGVAAYACDPPWKAAYRGRLEQLVREMGQDAGRVVLMTAPYPMGRWRYAGVTERVDCFDALIRETAGALALPVIDVAGHVCPTRECNLLSDGEPIRPDGLHPDGKGTEELARWTISELLRVTSADAGR